MANTGEGRGESVCWNWIDAGSGVMTNVNEDGKGDLVVGNYAGNIKVWVNIKLSLLRLVRARARFPALCVYTHSFVGCNAVTDVFVNAVALQCCEVESVDLTGCGLITDTSIMTLAESYPRLKSVSLTRCTLLTDTSVVALVRSCPQLKSLNLFMLQADHRRLHRGARGELRSAGERESRLLQAYHRRLRRGAQSRAPRRFIV